MEREGCFQHPSGIILRICLLHISQNTATLPCFYLLSQALQLLNLLLELALQLLPLIAVVTVMDLKGGWRKGTRPHEEALQLPRGASTW